MDNYTSGEISAIISNAKDFLAYMVVNEDKWTLFRNDKELEDRRRIVISLIDTIQKSMDGTYAEMPLGITEFELVTYLNHKIDKFRVSFTTSSTFDHYVSLTDPYTLVTSGYEFDYQITGSMKSGADANIDIPSAYADGYYHVTRIPKSQPIRASWYNNETNFGVFPDTVYRPVYVTSEYRYYITRVPASFNTVNPLILQA